MKVPFYRHNLGDKEKRAIHRVLNSVFLTTGPETQAFEKEFGQFFGDFHVIGTTSWTMGAFLVLKALDLKPGDEVITTPMTYVASANVILYCGAKPIFVDVEPETGNIDTQKIESAITSRTRGILPVHLYGQMCNMRAIRKLAKKHGLWIVEDCAHCVEGCRNGYRPGELSDAAVFSFYATKSLTCGEGGAVITRNQLLAQKVRLLRLHGISKTAVDRYGKQYQHWDMEVLGYKANLNDLQSALLRPQIKKLMNYRQRREIIAKSYLKVLGKTLNLSTPEILKSINVHAWHLFAVWVKPEQRDFALAWLQSRGIGVGVHFRAVHLLKYFRKTLGYNEGTFPYAEEIGASTFSLPLFPGLKTKEINWIQKSLLELDQLLL